MNIVSINTSQPVWKDWIAFHNCLKANKAGILVEAMLHITNYWLILPFLFVIEMLLVFQADIIALSKGKNRVHSVPRLHLPPCITATLSATGKHCPNLLRAQMASSCGSVISIAQWMDYLFDSFPFSEELTGSDNDNLLLLGSEKQDVPFYRMLN